MSLIPAMIALLVVPQGKVATTFTTTKTTKSDFYETSLKLPVLTGAPLADFATRQLSQGARASLADWMRQNFSGQAAKTKPNTPYFFQIQPFISMATPDLISMYFLISTYEGGAHGMTVFDAHTFALVDGKPTEVHAKDVFRGDVKYVDVVSSLLMSKLMEDPRAEWVHDGTVKSITPQQVNTFVVTPTSLTFLFNPYDLGPYAVGSFQVKVPISELASDLDPAGPLGSLLKR